MFSHIVEKALHDHDITLGPYWSSIGEVPTSELTLSFYNQVPVRVSVSPGAWHVRYHNTPNYKEITTAVRYLKLRDYVDKILARSGIANRNRIAAATQLYVSTGNTVLKKFIDWPPVASDWDDLFQSNWWLVPRVIISHDLCSELGEGRLIGRITPLTPAAHMRIGRDFNPCRIYVGSLGIPYDVFEHYQDGEIRAVELRGVE